MTIQEFIAKHAIAMSCVALPSRTDRVARQSEQDKKWDREAGHYLLTFTGAGSKTDFATPYSVGVGIIDAWMQEKNLSAIAGFAAEAVRAGLKGNRSVWAQDALAAARAKARLRYVPDAASVLDNCASDAWGVENARSFEDWASEYGYDPDSRSVEAVYQACQRQAQALRSWLGAAAFAELLNCERM